MGDPVMGDDDGLNNLADITVSHTIVLTGTYV